MTAPDQGHGELKRIIGRADVALLVIGSVIGSGIFLVPGGVLTQSSGSVGLAMLAWLFGGVLSFLGALTYAELGAMQPHAGGLYLYVRDAFGRLPAFLYGWVIFFCICAGTVATLAVASSTYLEQFIQLGPVGRKLVSVLIVAAIALINVRGTRISVTALNWGTGIKVAALAFLILVLPFFGPGLGQVDPWFPPDLSVGILSGVGLAMISVLWAYEGWQYATFVAGEVRDPQRNLPAGLAIGTLALIVIYVAANLAYLAALGPEGVGRSERVAAEAMQASFGPTAARLIAIPIIISMVSAAHSVILTMPRTFFAMARDGLFFRKLGEVHPRWGTPAFAIIAGSVVAALLSLIGGFEQLLSYVIFVGWMFYGLAGASIFVFRRTRADAPRPFRVPGYPLTPLLFVLSAAAIVINAIFTQPIRQTLLGLGVVATGLPAYLIWRSRSG
ncbi:MAG TPA: amino acid permease [Gemmatimonadales bacterium]|nr:amino acid permease [Gemmatimonadales bacterium]